ncbi:MerR family transcriptional regulator [Streptomyces sp. NPDC059477]|uniref:DNA polymerase III subunit beta family protein n=1 Tax=Streptomyces sp. NPDC059477 TaxID=3346847 RepID=UPI0036AF9060
MPHDDLMPIGPFARRSGLTPSALRFFADSGLLPPARVDPVTGYRHYAPDQVPRATTLRRLREIGLSLPAVAKILDAGPGDAARLIDAHVTQVTGDAADVRRKAALLKTGLAPARPVAALKGPVLADAIEQILTATARDPHLPVLGGLRVEATPEAITLTATDRYRLATRTLVPAGPPPPTTEPPWSATLDGDDLRAALTEIRRSPLVRVEATPYGVLLRLTDRADQHCRTLPGDFPDHHLMLAALPEVTTRVTVAKAPLLHALEEHPEDHITLRLTGEGVRIPPGTGSPRTSAPLPATVTGDDLDITFAVTTLYPALSTALGPDVLLDLRGPGSPATIRSADRGDLTTWAMPVKPAPPAEPPLRGTR